MKARISDTHDAHGSVFTLNLELEKKRKPANRQTDDQTIEFLHRQFDQIQVQKGGKTFYIYEASRTKTGLTITFSENPILMAKVDHNWNQDRNDQKFPVLLLDIRAKEHASVPHFPCHWCRQYVFGVKREAVMVYDSPSGKMKLVQAHMSCQEIREKQIAGIAFPSSR